MEVGNQGFSPFQIVHGRSSAIPGVLGGNVCTDSIMSDAEVVRKHFKRQDDVRRIVR